VDITPKRFVVWSKTQVHPRVLHAVLHANRTW
jgi:hypothetical protein